MGIFGTKGATAMKGMLCLSVIMLASCRLVMETDETGTIVSESDNFNCDQAKCIWHIDEEYSEVLTAVPNSGYRFVRWSGLCSRFPTDRCEIELAPTPPEYMQYDGDIPVAAEFEHVTTQRAWYRDADGDHYGDPEKSLTTSEQLPGYVINNKDCDDNNCNGKIDEGFNTSIWYRDHDRDGWGNPNVTQISDRQPLDFIANNLDCDDNDNGINPEAREITNDGIDNNCDGLIDEPGKRFYLDADDDGFGRRHAFITAREVIEGYADNRDDCDDENPDVYPNAPELLDSLDNDCDGRIDEGLINERFFKDQDGDTYGDPEKWLEDLVAPDGYVENSDDNCPDDYNPFQEDEDKDGLGDVCDDFTDSDEDEVQDSEDNCPYHWNPNQEDADNNGLGDACEEIEDEEPACTVTEDGEWICTS